MRYPSQGGHLTALAFSVGWLRATRHAWRTNKKRRPMDAKNFT
jgi:hypothetical protein